MIRKKKIAKDSTHEGILAGREEEKENKRAHSAPCVYGKGYERIGRESRWTRRRIKAVHAGLVHAAALKKGGDSKTARRGKNKGPRGPCSFPRVQNMPGSPSHR